MLQYINTGTALTTPMLESPLMLLLQTPMRCSITQQQGQHAPVMHTCAGIQLCSQRVELVIDL